MGFHYAVIARELGVKFGLVYKTCRAHLPRRVRWTTEAERQRIIERRKENRTLAEIAREFGVNKSTVQRILERDRGDDEETEPSVIQELPAAVRCPICRNLVTTVPCVACLASGKSQRADNPF